jgi:hypothetical protein
MQTICVDEYKVYVFTELLVPAVVIENAKGEYHYSRFGIATCGDDRESAVNGLVHEIRGVLRPGDTTYTTYMAILEESELERVYELIDGINETIEIWKTIHTYELNKFEEGYGCCELTMQGILLEKHKFIVYSDKIFASVGIFPSDDYIGPIGYPLFEPGTLPIREIVHTLDDLFAMMHREIKALERFREWIDDNLIHAVLK